MRRLFVGLSLPQIVIDRLRATQSGIHGARWRPTENFHITLTFIGETHEAMLTEIDAVLKTVSMEEFRLSLEGGGVFGNRKPRAVWIGVKHNTQLMKLQEKIRNSLHRSGIELERRRYIPHVTMAYLAGVSREAVGAWCSANNFFATAPFKITEFHLYESHLGRGVSQYQIINSYSLSSSM